MIYVKIGDTRVEDMKLDDLKAFFHEHVFFKFMDSGRTGVTNAVPDVIDNFVQWIEARGAFGRAKLTKRLGLERYLDLTKRASAEIVDGLIMRGSAGIKDAVNAVYLMTLDALVEENS